MLSSYKVATDSQNTVTFKELSADVDFVISYTYTIDLHTKRFCRLPIET